MKKIITFLIGIVLILYLPFSLLMTYFLMADFGEGSIFVLLIIGLPLVVLLLTFYYLYRKKDIKYEQIPISKLNILLPVEKTNQPSEKQQPHDQPMYSKNLMTQHIHFEPGYILTEDYSPNFVILDFLTSNPNETDIIRVSACKYINFKLINQYYSYVWTDKAIKPQMTILTVITDKDIKDAPPIDRVLRELLHFIDRQQIVVHDIEHQMNLLLFHLDHCEIEPPIYSVFDTLPLAKQSIPLPNHQLLTLKTYLNLHALPAHNATTNCFIIQKLYENGIKQTVNF